VRRAQRQWWSARQQLTANLLAKIGATLDVSTLAAMIEYRVAARCSRKTAMRACAGAILAEAVIA
jgi:hypothetical protein